MEIFLLIIFVLLVICNKIEKKNKNLDMIDYLKSINFSTSDNNISNNNTQYDDLFSYQIISRGYDYYKNNKVKSINNKNKKYTAVVEGTKNYNVKIEFNNDKSIKNMSCDCPYFKDRGDYCKHMYAALCKIENINTKDNSKVSNVYKLINIIDDMNNILEEANQLDYLDNEYYESLMEYEDIIDKYNNTKASLINDDIINEAECDLLEIEDLYNSLEEYNDNYQEKRSRLAKNPNIDNEERDTSGYEDYNFEEEDLEEDDYYYEDDDMNE